MYKSVSTIWNLIVICHFTYVRMSYYFRTELSDIVIQNASYPNGQRVIANLVSCLLLQTFSSYLEVQNVPEIKSFIVKRIQRQFISFQNSSKARVSPVRASSSHPDLSCSIFRVAQPQSSSRRITLLATCHRAAHSCFSARPYFCIVNSFEQMSHSAVRLYVPDTREQAFSSRSDSFSGEKRRFSLLVSEHRIQYRNIFWHTLSWTSTMRYICHTEGISFIESIIDTDSQRNYCPKHGREANTSIPREGVSH